MTSATVWALWWLSSFLSTSLARSMSFPFYIPRRETRTKESLSQEATYAPREPAKFGAKHN